MTVTKWPRGGPRAGLHKRSGKQARSWASREAPPPQSQLQPVLRGLFLPGEARSPPNCRKARCVGPRVPHGSAEGRLHLAQSPAPGSHGSHVVDLQCEWRPVGRSPGQPHRACRPRPGQQLGHTILLPARVRLAGQPRAWHGPGWWSVLNGPGGGEGGSPQQLHLLRQLLPEGACSATGLRALGQPSSTMALGPLAGIRQPGKEQLVPPSAGVWGFLGQTQCPS